MFSYYEWPRTKITQYKLDNSDGLRKSMLPHRFSRRPKTKIGSADWATGEVKYTVTLWVKASARFVVANAILVKPMS